VIIVNAKVRLWLHQYRRALLKEANSSSDSYIKEKNTKKAEMIRREIEEDLRSKKDK
jgi:hypothetical protein